jgi:hypothetical protein
MIGRLDRVRNSCLVNRVRFGHRVVLRCATAPHAQCFHHPKPRNWARRCRSRWPDAFSATNDVRMNASFVVEVQSN